MRISMRVGLGVMDPALVFSFRGLAVIWERERGGRLGELGINVLDEPLEMSVIERRVVKERPRYTGV